MPHSHDDEDDLGFRGWRDWVLAIVGGAIFLATLWAVVGFALGSRRGGAGAVDITPIGAAAVVAIALVLGLGFSAIKRWWQS